MKKVTVVFICFILLSCSKPQAPQVEKYLGLGIKSNEMQDFIKTLGTPKISHAEAVPPTPARTMESADGVIDTISVARPGFPASDFYKFQDKGIEMKVENDVVVAIFLFSGGQNDYKQYEYSLPFELKFTDTRKAVIDKFGKPDKYYCDDSSCEDSWSTSKGLSVTYNTTDSTNMSATISSLRLAKK